MLNIDIVVAVLFTAQFVLLIKQLIIWLQHPVQFSDYERWDNSQLRRAYFKLVLKTFNKFRNDCPKLDSEIERDGTYCAIKKFVKNEKLEHYEEMLLEAVIGQKNPMSSWVYSRRLFLHDTFIAAGAYKVAMDLDKHIHENAVNYL